MGLEIITDDTIDTVLSDNKYTVIDFWAEWCGPCRMLTPIIEQLAIANDDVFIGKVNVSDNPISSRNYEITSIPCIIFFNYGEEIGRIKGLMPKAQLQKSIDALKRRESDTL